MGEVVGRWERVEGGGRGGEEMRKAVGRWEKYRYEVVDVVGRFEGVDCSSPPTSPSGSEDS